MTNGNESKYVSLYVQNLSISKDKALEKGRELSDLMGLPFKEEIDFNLYEIERMERRAEAVIEDVIPALAPDIPNEWLSLMECDPDTLEGQDLAIYSILNGDNVFICGAGGVGKSYIIRQVVDANTVLCSFSGIAAINIGGTTCSKVFGLPQPVVLESDYRVDDKARTLFEGDVRRVVIDEISMLRADYLTLIDWKLKKIRNNDKPFGGIQMVVVGDFFQLPPVLKKEHEHAYYNVGGHKSIWAFTSDAWDFTTIELTKVFRQEDKRQANILNAIRKKTEKYKKALEVIQREAKEYDSKTQVLHLCTTNVSAKKVNDYWFNQLTSPVKTFVASVDGKFKASEIPVDEILRIREGAKVVICANHPEGNYQNGTRGTVKKITASTVLVETDNNKQVIIEKHKWTKHYYDVGHDGRLIKMEGDVFEQLPLKLGYAITFHKAQGMTLDEIAIDVGSNGCFSHGQLYVGLSRVRDLTNLSFVRYVNPSNVIVSEEVREFYEQR